MSRIIAPFTQLFDASGDPLIDGWLKFLETGTVDTLKTTYSDSALTIANTNPLQLSSAGRCPDVFGTGIYKVISLENNPVTKLPGEQIQSFDPVSGVTTTPYGTAAERDAEDTLTYGSKLPDGVAITEYVVTGTVLDLVSTANNVWLGKTATGVAGETLTGKQWCPLYCKDTGSGTRFYLYDADAAGADNYRPIALLKTDDTISAGDTITITVGEGILGKDDWTDTTPAAEHVGKAVFCTTTAGVVDFTRPTSGHAKQIGTLLNIAANGRDVWDISFRYLDWTI